MRPAFSPRSLTLGCLLSTLALLGCAGAGSGDQPPRPRQSKLDWNTAEDRKWLRGNLDRFYSALRKVDQGENKVVRVMLFGDSIIWGDCLTIRLKRRFQGDFGDGGRGLLNIVDEPATRLIDHVNLTRGDWRRDKIPYEAFSLPAFPNLGFTGFAYRPFPGASTTHIVGARQPVQGLAGWRRRMAAYGGAYSIPVSPPPKNARHGTRGESWRRLRLILRAPGGNANTGNPNTGNANTTAQLNIVTEAGANETLARTVALKTKTCSPIDIDLPPTRRFTLRFSGTQPAVDALAVETERGVSFSPIVLRGLHQAWLSGVPAEQFACGFRSYAPDLIIFQFGINESHSMLSGAGGFNAERYERQLRDFYSRLKTAAPDAAILLLGPWERLLYGRTYAAHAHTREIQKRVALDLNLGYFDGFRFMGGTAGFLKLARAGLVQSDFTHVTFPGGHYVADGLYAELMRDYKKWRQ